MSLWTTIIVPTHRRFETFQRCVDSLLVQTIPPNQYEVIAVHDGEDYDYDPEVIKRWEMQNPNFHFYIIPKGGASEARNFGIKESRGQFVLMTDDDCVAEPTWAKRLVKFLEEHPDMSATGGQVLAVEPETFIQEYIRFKNLLRRPVRNVQGKVVTLITANVCYRRSILEKIDGFSSRFREYGIPYGGEDLDLAFRAMRYGPLGYCEEAVVYHHHRSTLKALTKQHFLYGRGVYVACRENGIRYEDLRFSLPIWPNLLRHSLLSFIRLFTISIPEYRKKGLAIWKYPPYFGLDLLRRNIFMVGAVYEYYRQRRANHALQST